MNEMIVPYYINSSGAACVMQPVTATFYCKLDAWKFPFDTHSCSFILLSWMHTYGLLTIGPGTGIFLQVLPNICFSFKASVKYTPQNIAKRVTVLTQWSTLNFLSFKLHLRPRMNAEVHFIYTQIRLHHFETNYILKISRTGV